MNVGSKVILIATTSIISLLFCLYYFSQHIELLFIILFFLSFCCGAGLFLLSKQSRFLLKQEQKRREVYNAFLDTTTDLWAGWDINGNFLGCSHSFQKLFSFTKSISMYEMSNLLLEPDKSTLNDNIQKLTEYGTGFCSVMIEPRSKLILEISGERSSMSNTDIVCIWIKDITKHAKKFSELESNLKFTTQENSMANAMLDNVPYPIWSRDENLRLVYCNEAYAKAVKSTKNKVINEDTQLVSGSLTGQAKSLAENVIKSVKEQSILQTVSILGEKRHLTVTESPFASGTIGFAIDCTNELEYSSRLEKHIIAHGEVLGLLSTGVVIFDNETNLKFFNSAYVKLTQLDDTWLHSGPTYGEVLEELRSKRRLPEFADFPSYKQEQLKLFSTTNSLRQDLLHLPDGHTLRVVTAPYSLGGLLLIYEDVTDSLSLERQYNTLIEVQKETIDHLFEGIAVYSSDNRLKVSNAAFGKIWNLSPEQRSFGQHISVVTDLMKQRLYYENDWNEFKEETISKLTDRIPKTGKIICKDDSIINFAYVPLPDGAHMHSYIDVTDTCRIETALQERNQALELADKYKIEFFTSMGAEFREPLSTVIGLSDLLRSEDITEKQREYASGIFESGNQLLHVVNGLLDLAHINIGKLYLKISPINIRESISYVLETLSKKIKDKKINISLCYDLEREIFNADRRRLEQIIYNMIICAIYVTTDGEEIATNIKLKEKKLKISVFLKKTDAPIKRKTSTTFALRIPLIKNLAKIHDGSFNVNSTTKKGTFMVCELLEVAQHEQKNIEKTA